MFIVLFCSCFYLSAHKLDNLMNLRGQMSRCKVIEKNFYQEEELIYSDPTWKSPRVQASS